MIRRSLPSIFVAGLLMATAAPARAEPDPFGKLTVDEVAQKLGQKGVYVFDNNPIDVYKRGHVPHAKWVDYAHVQADALPADKEATLIFYCANEH